MLRWWEQAWGRGLWAVAEPIHVFMAGRGVVWRGPQTNIRSVHRKTGRLQGYKNAMIERIKYYVAVRNTFYKREKR